MADGDDAIIALVSKVTEFNDISEFMGDEDLDLALGYVVKLIAKPDIPPGAVQRAIVQLQALAVKFGFMAKKYVIFGAVTDEDKKKKNLYFTAEEQTNALVAALKYLTR
jgi:hypothetical protein